MQKLMKKIADGEEIVGDWPGTTTNIPLCGDCNGIQSPRLINFVLSSVAGAYKYATDQGWNIQNNNWHASGCTNNDVDDNGRCMKCRSAKNNINQSRHSIMFQEEDSDCSTIAPIDNDVIRKGIKDRLNVINKSGLDVSTDNALQHAARLLRINNSDGVDIGGSKMFMVCIECSEHRVCKKRANNGSLCQRCKKKEDGKRRLLKKREQHFDKRTAVNSTTPWKFLTEEELSARSQNVTAERNRLKAQISRLKDKIQKQDIELEMTLPSSIEDRISLWI